MLPLFGNYVTSNIGIWLTDEKLPVRYKFQTSEMREFARKNDSTVCGSNCYKIDHIIADSTQYTKIAYTYTAKGGERYIYIGNLFFTQDQFWKKKGWQKVDQFGVRPNLDNTFMCTYGVDDVSVVPLDSSEDGCPVEIQPIVQTEDAPDTVIIAEKPYDLDAQTTASNLDGVAALVNSLNGSVEVLVQGYADDLGSAAYNYQLSKNRAVNIARQLSGLVNCPIQVQALGESKPKYSGDQSHLNRRVEIYLIKKPGS